MYAVISTGGKQYRLEQGDLIKVESLKGAVGDKVVFDEILAMGDEKTSQIGTPLLAGAQVIGTIVEQGRGPKVKVLKFKRRKMYRKKTGHRQQFTAVKIDSISSGEKAAKKPAAARKRKPAATKSEGKEAAKTAAAPKKRKPAAKKPAATETKRTAGKKTTTKPKSE
jgi:large subunit ribosomal protein L21